MMKIQVIHGPNLNMLGKREVNVYGTITLDKINELIKNEAQELEFDVKVFQSNHEGEIIDELHACYNKVDGVIINPGAYTHYSYAIRDAITSINIPTIEVHLSNIEDRESFRKNSVTKDVCITQIMGKGYHSYIEALKYFKSYKNKVK